MINKSEANELARSIDKAVGVFKEEQRKNNQVMDKIYTVYSEVAIRATAQHVKKQACTGGEDPTTVTGILEEVHIRNSARAYVMAAVVTRSFPPNGMDVITDRVKDAMCALKDT